MHAMLEPARHNGRVQVVAVAARDPARAQEFAQRYGIPQVASTYSDLIERSDIDMIYIGLPPSHHAEWTLRALGAGKAVLCEKPLAMNAHEAQVMASTATTATRPLLEALHYRFHPTMTRALAIVRSELGRLRSMQATMAGSAPADPDDIRWRADLGGGALLDLGCYAVHALRTLAGGEPVVQHARSTMRGSVDLVTEATLRFDTCEHAHMLCSFDAATFTNTLHLVGERGTLDIQGFMAPHRGGSIRLIVNGVSREESLATTTTYHAQLAHVVAVMEGRERALTGATDAIANARVLDAIRVAAARA